MKPILITAVIGLLLVGVQQIRLMSCETTVAERDITIVKLDAAIGKQNDGIDKMKLAGELDSSQAGNRAITVLSHGETLKRTLPKGAGQAVMNQFMRGLFQ